MGDRPMPQSIPGYYELTQSVIEDESYRRLTISGAFWNLFVVKSIVNFHNEHGQKYYCHGATFGFCSHGESYFDKAGYPA